MHDTSYKSIEIGISLLIKCQTLQSEKDGIQRLRPGIADIHNTRDEFARDIDTAVSNFGVLYRTIAYFEQLVVIGKRLEADGKVCVDADGYAHAALRYFTAEAGLPISPTTADEILNQQMASRRKEEVLECAVS